MAIKNIYFISDVHIGTDEPTNWYQSSVHGEYLDAIFNYIIDDKESVQEVVLLGDLVDLWMYTTDALPPDFKTITLKNPAIFGPQGILMRTLDELKGKVTYVNGNHDMMVTGSDIASLKSPGGYTLKYSSGILYEPGNCGNKIICTHGHIYSLLCSPDYCNSPAGFPGLPFGYFATRMSVRLGVRQFNKAPLPEEPNFAYLKDSGNPCTSIIASNIIKSLCDSKNKGTGGTSMLLSAVKDVVDDIGDVLTGALDVDIVTPSFEIYWPDADPKSYFLMPDGTKLTPQEVKNLYKNVYSNYPASTKVPPVYFLQDDNQMRQKAFERTDMNSDLSSFAELLEHDHKIVIMGHTHKDTIINSAGPALYCNTGFNCPCVPEMESKENNRSPTFTQAGIDNENNRFTLTIFKAVKNASQKPEIQIGQGPVEISF